jgi:hypothetical protein
MLPLFIKGDIMELRSQVITDFFSKNPLLLWAIQLKQDGAWKAVHLGDVGTLLEAHDNYGKYRSTKTSVRVVKISRHMTTDDIQVLEILRVFESE